MEGVWTYAYSVRYGSSNPNVGGVFQVIEKIIVHPLFNRQTPVGNDIALIEVSGFIDTHIGLPVKLPSTHQQVIANTSCLVSGWGRTLDSSLRRDELRAVHVPIWNHETCMAVYPGQTTQDMFCAGYETGGRDACQVNPLIIKIFAMILISICIQGDSGGPLVCGTTLTGIVSWGKECAVMGKPGVYTKVAYYLDWIREYTGF